MLKALRNKKTQKRIYLVLAIAIIPPFLFWGISVSQKESASSWLGKIDGRTVTVQDYLASYKAVQHQMLLAFGEQAQRIQGLMNPKGQAWDRILLLHHAKKERLKTSDREVVEWIANQPAFFNKGRFNQKFYQVFVTNFLRTNPRTFEEELRGTLTIGKIRERLKSKIKLDDKRLEWLYKRKSKEEILNKKTDLQMQMLLESLRGRLRINPEAMKDLFPAEDQNPETPITR